MITPRRQQDDPHQAATEAPHRGHGQVNQGDLFAADLAARTRTTRVAIISLAAGVTLAVMAYPWFGKLPPVTRGAGVAPAPPPIPPLRRAASETRASVVQRVSASVVNVTTSRAAAPSDGPTLRWLQRRYGPGIRGLPAAPWGAGRGSGVVVSTDGLVLTSAHVVAGARRARVTLADGRELDAMVIGADARTDVALLRLQGQPPNLRPVAMGSSARMRPGDPVLAVGNPFGRGPTATQGIVSAMGRAELGLADHDDFIQTDAALTPGSSGGALVNMSGELVGLSTAAPAGGNSVGFAVPVDLVRPVMTSLLKHGKVRRGWLGVGLQELLPRLRAALALAMERGALVAHVVPGSPASKAGLRPRDVVLSFNSAVVGRASRLRTLLATTEPGTRVTLGLVRGGKQQTVTAVLAELPTRPAPVFESPADDHTSVEGSLVVSALVPSARRRYSIPAAVSHGVVVERVSPHSPAADAGLDPGDVILELDRVPLRSVAQFHRLMGPAGDRVLRVHSGGTATFLLVPGYGRVTATGAR